MIPPHFVAATTRKLSAGGVDGGAGNVTISLSQSQLWLADGETASAFITVTTADGSKPSVAITRANLHKSNGKDDGLGELVEAVTFHDDGVAPDLTANDNIFSAIVPPHPNALTGASRGLIVDCGMTAGGEQGDFQFRFTATGPVPAKFTGVVTSAIEQGSLAFHVGVDVYRAGRYNIMGRLYDAKGKPAALLTFVGTLSLDAREVLFVAFGKTLRDQALSAPFELRDLEGFLYVDGADSDRSTMAVWAGPHATTFFDVAQLSDAEWDSPGRWKKIDAVKGVIANGPSDIAPVDENGIPLPPKPVIPPPPKK